MMDALKAEVDSDEEDVASKKVVIDEPTEETGKGDGEKKKKIRSRQATGYVSKGMMDALKAEVDSDEEDVASKKVVIDEPTEETAEKGDGEKKKKIRNRQGTGYVSKGMINALKAEEESEEEDVASK